MDETNRRAVEALEQSIEWLATQVPAGLEPSYLRAIEAMENLPENRPGADKTWVVRFLAMSRQERTAAVRCR
jgi:hypothetical protein